MSQISQQYIGQVFNPQTGQYEQKLITVVQKSGMQQQISGSQIYTIPSLQNAQCSNDNQLLNQMSLPTESMIPMVQRTTTVINIPVIPPASLLTEAQNRAIAEQREQENLVNTLIHVITETIKPNEISNTYLFFFGLKVLLQIMFMLYLIVSLGFYTVRPTYVLVEEGNTKYFRATSEPKSKSNYHCTEVQNSNVLSIINKADAWVYLCASFIMLYKIFYIKKSASQFKTLYNQKYISNSQKFDISYIDYINIFFDYVFVISLSPLTAIVYEECANLRYGIYVFNAVATYAAGIVFSLFSFCCFVVLLECCKAETFDKLMYYPFLIMIVLPASAILAMAFCGLAILSSPVNTYLVTTYYTDGSSKTEQTDDSGKYLLVIFPIIGILFVIAFFACMILVSFALIFVFCHPAIIVYYILSLILTLVFLYLNRKGIDYREQLTCLYMLNILKNQYREKFEEHFDIKKLDEQNNEQNKKYRTFQVQTTQFIQQPKQVLYKYNARQTCQHINQYETFFQGVIVEKQERMYQANTNKPAINEVEVR